MVFVKLPPLLGLLTTFSWIDLWCVPGLPEAIAFSIVASVKRKEKRKGVKFALGACNASLDRCYFPPQAAVIHEPLLHAGNHADLSQEQT